MGALKAERHIRTEDGSAMQVAALPYRVGERLEVLLVTSRDTGRWVLPKGWPMKGKAPHEAAAREALEEAGVTGRIETRAIGAYAYAKQLGNGAALDCLVQVFPMVVERQLARWPEMGERIGQWFSTHDAAQAVNEPALAALIESFAPRDGLSPAR
jgi:8-oxo-dGTP pyrophosphatase MutT (NUDIX family)